MRQWGQFVIAIGLLLSSAGYAGELLSKPGMCLASIAGGGQPFPHLKEPGRFPWTKLDGVWEDVIEPDSPIIGLTSDTLIGGQRLIHVEFISNSRAHWVAEGEAQVTKDAHEIPVVLTGTGAPKIEARLSVREILETGAPCSGKRVFYALVTYSKGGKRIGQPHQWVLSQIDP